MNYVAQYIQEATEILRLVDQSTIERTADLLLDLREYHGRLFLLGGGGGAGHASHAVCDFRKLAEIEAYWSSDNVSEVTAGVNDDGWESCYVNWHRGCSLHQAVIVLALSLADGDAGKDNS